MGLVQRYSSNHRRFVPGLGTDVAEDHVGWGDGELMFPGISSCTGVLAITDTGLMAGMHLTISTPGFAVDAMADKLVEYLNNAAPKKLLLFGVLTAQATAAGPTNPSGGWKLQPKYHWPTQVQTFKAALGGPNAEVRVLTQHDHTNTGMTLDYRVVGGHGAQFTMYCRPARSTSWTACSTVRMS